MCSGLEWTFKIRKKYLHFERSIRLRLPHGLHTSVWTQRPTSIRISMMMMPKRTQSIETRIQNILYVFWFDFLFNSFHSPTKTWEMGMRKRLLYRVGLCRKYWKKYKRLMSTSKQPVRILCTVVDECIEATDQRQAERLWNTWSDYSCEKAS